MPARLPIPLLLALLVGAALVAGCGSSDEGSGTTGGAAFGDSASGQAGYGAARGEETPDTAPPASEAPAGVTATSCDEAEAEGGEVRVTGVSCDVGRDAVAAWAADETCPPPDGASRGSCELEDFTCLSVVTERGTAVSCVGPGRSLSFVAARD